jgi:hypothetical protein
MSYCKKEVDRAERKIKDANCPGLHLERGDFGFALYASQGDNFWVIFRPLHEEFGEAKEISSTWEQIDELISEWKKGP